jgi:hypothetical protein
MMLTLCKQKQHADDAKEDEECKAYNKNYQMMTL